LKSFEDKIAKAESKLMECKTNEEYKAAQKEVENQKEESARIEDDILKLMTELDGKRARLETDEKEYMAYEEGFRTDKRNLDAEKTRLEELLKTAEERQVEFRNALMDDIRGKYDRTARGGVQDTI